MLPVLVTVAVASFADKSAHPVFPQWLAFLGIWAMVLLLPGQLIFFFKDRPFAWDGILAFWVPPAFAPWFIVMTVMMLKVLKRERGNVRD